MKDKVRYLWHEIYYKIASPSGVDFAMTCKDAVAQIDLGDPPTTWMAWFRQRLHLSLCQACNNYFHASKALGRAIRELAKGSGVPLDIKEINRELLLKYGRRSKS